MNLKIIFFVLIFTMLISGGSAIGESGFSLGGVKSNYGGFSRNLSPLSELAVQDPLTRLNAEVDAGRARVTYRSHFGSPGYRFYRRSPGHTRHFKSSGHYFRYGYQRPFYREEPYEYYFQYRPYRHYYQYKYFRYYLPSGLYYNYWHYGFNDYGYNLGLPWYCR